MRYLTIHSLVALMVAGLVAVDKAEAGAGGCKSSTAKLTYGSADIVDTAVAAGSFNTLVAAVKAAGLAEALKGEGPFTVFAPTDEAFAKLPEGTVEGLLNDLPKLRSILKYHVVAGSVDAAQVAKLSSAETLLGQSLSLRTQSGVQVDNAKVTAADIRCRNGIIHVIDTVLLPKDDIVDVAAKAGSFNTLLAALNAADLNDTLRGQGPLTVFAPTDEAFAKLPAGTVEALLNDIPRLRSILTYHVVPSKVLAADVVRLDEAKTVQGSKVRIDTSSGVRINNAQVVKTDINAANGVIHVIDEVLLPH
jgi:transforming growth factor-beta-induced protein